LKLAKPRPLLGWTFGGSAEVFFFLSPGAHFGALQQTTIGCLGVILGTEPCHWHGFSGKSPKCHSGRIPYPICGLRGDFAVAIFFDRHTNPATVLCQMPTVGLKFIFRAS